MLAEHPSLGNQWTFAVCLNDSELQLTAVDHVLRLLDPDEKCECETPDF